MKSFAKNNIDHSPIVDNVFTIANKAAKAIQEYGKDHVINATIGSLYNESGTIVALNSVFDTYNKIANEKKAKYASGIRGNEDYQKRVYEWVTQGVELDLCHSVVATPGGSGAISATINNILDQGETLIIPDIAWGSYKLMATMANLNVQTYSMFDGNNFNLESFKATCTKVMQQQGKVLAILNDPCHNPTGYSLSSDEWKQLTDIINELSKEGPFVLLNDIAYIDFSYDLNMSRDYMNNFNHFSDNVMVVVAFSCSKTLTSYGLRCGACLVMAKKEEVVAELITLVEKHARACWSNIPNGAMENFVAVTTEHLDEFMQEKQYYIDLMKERTDTIKKEADACGLEYYPYKEGFFVTLKVEDPALLKAYHEKLMENHIYTIQVNKGIRIGACSLSIKQCNGLAYRMKEILDEVRA